MKKNLLSFMAIALAISAIVLQSHTSLPKDTVTTDQTTFDWYQVNADDEIINTSPSYSDMTKSAVVGVDPCKDQVLPNCYYGTNGTVTLGQDISGEPSSQKIRKKL